MSDRLPRVPRFDADVPAVDPDVGRLPNVRCYDIDDLAARLNDSLAERQQEIPQVEAIIAAEADAFMAWLQSLEIMPVISDLRAKADAIRRAEVDKNCEGRLEFRARAAGALSAK